MHAREDDACFYLTATNPYYLCLVQVILLIRLPVEADPAADAGLIRRGDVFVFVVGPDAVVVVAPLLVSPRAPLGRVSRIILALFQPPQGQEGKNLRQGEAPSRM